MHPGPPTRAPRPGPRLAGVALVVAGVLLAGTVGAACGRGDVAAPPPERAADGPTAPAPRPRPVPGPVDGALRASIDTVPLPERDRTGADPATSTGTSTGTAAGAAPADVLLFGDSVSILVADDLAAELDGRLHVDGVDCRRLDLAFRGPCGGVPAGVDVPDGVDGLRTAVDDLARAGTRPDAAVLVIANNAFLDPDDVDAVLEILADVDRVWWVTTDVEGRGWRDPNNALLAEVAAADDATGDRVRTIDWRAIAEGRDVLADHVHPHDAGQALLAALVGAHLRCDCTDPVVDADAVLARERST